MPEVQETPGEKRKIFGNTDGNWKGVEDLPRVTFQVTLVEEKSRP